MRSTTSTDASARADLLSTPTQVEALAERVGHPFGDPALLDRAICHRSWCAENPGFESNERLEFLGDAVLGLIVADHVFTTYPAHDEGWLSRARSAVVRASALADMARELDLGAALRLGKGEDASGGRDKPSILADALEAVIGAVYLDGGWVSARSLVVRLIGDRLSLLPGGRGEQDHKSRLQELAMRRFQAQPVYAVTEDGPEHDKTFLATVHVDGRSLGTGSGRSKKQAEQDAASAALDALDATGAVDGSAAPGAPAPVGPAAATIAPPTGDLHA